MIEVFKTTVKKKKIADLIVKQIENELQNAAVNFDLADCDRILRINCKDFDLEKVEEIIKNHGFEVSRLA